MELAEYQSRIATEAGILRSAAVRAGPHTPVPTCPGWTAQRLMQHVARVFDMVSWVLRTADPATPPPRPARRGDKPASGSDAALADVDTDFDPVLADFDERLAVLLELLASTDPDTPVWHFAPTAPHTAAFWSRRMAHEVTVHRIDAQTAAGIDAPVDPGFAADGIDEVLTRHLARHTESWAVAELSGTVLYHAADAGRAWTVRLVPGQLPQTAPETVDEPDASVVGLADAVYRAAWGRPSRAMVSGDAHLLAATRAG